MYMYIAAVSTDCQPEEDKKWHISWPSTSVGATATQKCNGRDSVG